MEIVTTFDAYEVKHGDAVFTIKPIDLSRVALKHTVKKGEELMFDNTSFIDEVVNQSVVGWTGVVSKESKEALPCVPENVALLPYAVKVVIYSEMAKTMSLDEEKKSS